MKIDKSEVIALRRRGYTYAKIGSLLGCTRQNIEQILKSQCAFLTGPLGAGAAAKRSRLLRVSETALYSRFREFRSQFNWN